MAMAKIESDVLKSLCEDAVFGVHCKRTKEGGTILGRVRENINRSFFRRLFRFPTMSVREVMRMKGNSLYWNKSDTQDFNWVYTRLWADSLVLAIDIYQLACVSSPISVSHEEYAEILDAGEFSRDFMCEISSENPELWAQLTKDHKEIQKRLATGSDPLRERLS